MGGVGGREGRVGNDVHMHKILIRKLFNYCFKRRLNRTGTGLSKQHCGAHSNEFLVSVW